jgi:hypothetical protein
MVFFIIITTFVSLYILDTFIFNNKNKGCLRLFLFALLSYFIAIISTTTECRDGWDSNNIGKQGACSWHGGVVTKLNTFGKYEILFSFIIIGIYLLIKMNKQK